MKKLLLLLSLLISTTAYADIPNENVYITIEPGKTVSISTLEFITGYLWDIETTGVKKISEKTLREETNDLFVTGRPVTKMYEFKLETDINNGKVVFTLSRGRTIAKTKTVYITDIKPIQRLYKKLDSAILFPAFPDNHMTYFLNNDRRIKFTLEEMTNGYSWELSMENVSVITEQVHREDENNLSFLIYNFELINEKERGEIIFRLRRLNDVKQTIKVYLEKR